jgi:hypothetical protein
MIRLVVLLVLGIPVVSLLFDATRPPAPATISVLVARKHLPVEASLQYPEKLFKPIRYFKGEEPKDAVTSFDQLRDKVLVRPLAEDQPLKTSDLAAPNRDNASPGLVVRFPGDK